MCLLLRSNYPEILITLEENGTAVLSDRPRLYLLSLYSSDNCLSTQADFSVRLWSHQVYGPQQRHIRSWGQCISSSGFSKNWMRKHCMWLAVVSEDDKPLPWICFSLFWTPAHSDSDMPMTTWWETMRYIFSGNKQ